MNKIGVSIVSGLIGATIGFGSCYIFLKKKFEKQSDAEIEMMRKVINSDIFEEEENKADVSYKPTQEDIKTNTKLTSQYRNEDPKFESADVDDDDVDTTWGYDNNGNRYDAPDKTKPPYHIPYEELGERPYFDLEHYQMYDDGTIVDEYGEFVEPVDRETFFGPKSNLTPADDSQPDIIALRNEALQLDMEITLVSGTYLNSKGVT